MLVVVPMSQFTCFSSNIGLVSCGCKYTSIRKTHTMVDWRENIMTNFLHLIIKLNEHHIFLVMFLQNWWVYLNYEWRIRKIRPCVRQLFNAINNLNGDEGNFQITNMKWWDTDYRRFIEGWFNWGFASSRLGIELKKRPLFEDCDRMESHCL